MKTRWRLAALLLLAVVLPPAPGWARTWTNAEGTGSVEADFEDFNDGKVWLRKEDGGSFGVPMAMLSKSDQKYVYAEVRRRHDAIGVRTKPQPGDVKYAPARKLATLANTAIDESSGLACSRRMPGRFWTHNDSGDDARLYLFDTQGRDCGSFLLHGVQAYDWEDIASFRMGGKPYLLIGDVGNNGLAAEVQILYVVEEPPIDPQRGVTVKEVTPFQVLYFAYADDHHDCEAVAIDPTSRTFFMATKERGQSTSIYSFPWPQNRPKKAITARQIAKLKFSGATGMDISPDGLRAVVVTYGNAFEYTRRADEDWGKGFSRPPREIVLPDRAQGEAICYGADGKTLYLTSERLPTPLWEVPVK